MKRMAKKVGQTRFGTSLAVLAALAMLGFSVADVEAQVDVSGSIDGFYQYAFNGVDPFEVRTFDGAHNAFTLSLAEIAIEMAPGDESRVGGRVDLNFGTTADIVGSTDSVDEEIYKHVQQAYISYMPSETFTLDFGKFVTPIGAEVIESQDNWNYSRSILFGYAIPFNHVGLRATFAATDVVSISGFLLNGWNNSIETNSDKTFAASVSVAPNDQFSWIGNVIVGNEFDNDGDGEEDLLWLFDTTASFAATDMVSLMGNLDYGKNSNAAGPGGSDDQTWWGIAGYVRLQLQDDFAIAGRWEYVDDSEGGFMGIGEKVQSFTVTGERMIDDLIARLELRIDRAESDDFFLTDDTSDPFTQNQPSLAASWVYTF